MARYRKIEQTMWGDEKFRRLSQLQPSGQALWIYFLAGPDTCIIPGVIRAGRASIAEVLQWSLADLDACFAELADQGMVKADWNSRLVFLPRGISHNLPNNPNQVMGWRKEFDLLPETPLVEAIRAEIVKALSALDQEAGKKGPWALKTWFGNQKSLREQPKEPVGESQDLGLESSSAKGGIGSAKTSAEAAENAGVSASIVQPEQNVSAMLVQPDLNVSAAPNGVLPGTINDLATTKQTVSEPLPKPFPNGFETRFETSNSNSNSNSISNSTQTLMPEAVASSIADGQQAAQRQKQQAGGSEVGLSPEGQVNPGHQGRDGLPGEQFSLVAPAVDPVVVEIPLKGLGKSYPLLESKVAQYEEVYPLIDVRASLLRCRQWNIDNPFERKTAVGVLRHVNAWLSNDHAKQAAALRLGGKGRAGESSAPVLGEGAETPEAFRKFWAAYPPGHGDQEEALQVWRMRYANATDDMVVQLMRGLAGWTASDDWLKEGGRYIPNAARFLREERWRAAPASSHFGVGSRESHEAEARFSGMTLREIKKIQAQERAGGA